MIVYVCIMYVIVYDRVSRMYYRVSCVIVYDYTH